MNYLLPDASLEIKMDLTAVGSKDNLINANNDIQAVQAWLAQFDNKHTYAAYKKDALRFLVWCSYVQGKDLSSLKLNDLEQYKQFLVSVPPEWRTVKNFKKFDISWRPFKGSLGLTAVQSSMTNLKSLFSFLLKSGYIENNPISIFKVKRKNLAEQKFSTNSRMLEYKEWQALQETLYNLPENSPIACQYKARANLLFALLYILGLRIAEAANIEWQNFKKIDSRWWVFIKGKAEKLGQIPVNNQLFTFLMNYRAVLGLDLQLSKDCSYIFSNSNGKPLTSRALYNVIKQVGRLAASAFTPDSLEYHKLCKLSPHWLRHLSASHQDKIGVPVTMIRENHRHNSINTTQIYMHSEDLQRHELMQQHQLKLKEVDILKTPEAKKHKLTIKLNRGPLNYVNALNIITSCAKKLAPKEVKITALEKGFSFTSKEEVPHNILNQIHLMAKVWLFDVVETREYV